MPKLLAIESSSRGDYSITRKLTATFIADWKAQHPGGTVVVRDLMKPRFPSSTCRGSWALTRLPSSTRRR